MEAREGQAQGCAPTLRARGLRERFAQVRSTTNDLCAPLELADHEGQSMPDCSPTKWHLAHTTWFFDVFVLEPFERNYVPFDPAFRVLFNSYYQQVGPRQLRCERGLLSRPSLARVLGYREQVEARVLRLLESDAGGGIELLRRVELGCHHEQQHQELILTDIKHLFSRNLLCPVYREASHVYREASHVYREASHAQRPAPDARSALPPLSFIEVAGDIYRVGHAGRDFCYDNELPRHRVVVEPFQVGTRLITNGEYEAFIADGGYQRHELWLDQGFSHATQHGWLAPLYWRGTPGEYREFTLHGEQPLRSEQPVCHISYYEADAFARWSGARLLTEQEWEVVAGRRRIRGNLLDSRLFHPCPVSERSAGEGDVAQLYGDVWEWTRSSYEPYPGYRPAEGALGEYNGKFMCNQRVLRGGSCVTDPSHLRPSYRNFFYAKDRWQFSGLRLAKDL